MKNFQKAVLTNVQAVQYGMDELAEDLVALCTKDYQGKIKALPPDLLGRPDDAFYAVKTNSGWQEIKPSDWIVKKESEVLVLTDSVFKLFFEAVE